MARKKGGGPLAPYWRPTPLVAVSGLDELYYHGLRGVFHCHVLVNDQVPLPLRLDLRSHSPAGFAWGYGGSGPAQLALALLAHALPWHPHITPPPVMYQRYKVEVIGWINVDDWIILRSDIVRWLRDQADEDCFGLPEGELKRLLHGRREEA